MKKLIYYFPLSLSLIIWAQQPLPGGVPGPALWLQSTQNTSQTLYRSPISEFTDSQPNTQERYILNGNPAKYFGEQTYRLPLNGMEKDQLSIFCVYQLKDTLSESHVWSLEQPNKLHYELSSFRFADLNSYQYRNLRVSSQKYPELHTYTHFKDSLYTNPFALVLGKKSTLETLPIDHFQGILPEMIIYPRVLSSIEKQKVESYLAIKYGLNLSRLTPTNYINSQGHIIWNAKENQEFHHNVFAIATDELTGLRQLKSSSSYAPELLQIEFSPTGEVPNLESIFMADNGKPLLLSDTENGKPLTLERQWRISSQNFQDIQLRLNLSTIEKRNPEEFLYLEIDPQGTPGQAGFPLQYVRIPKEDQSLTLENYRFDIDGNGADILGIIQAPEMFVQCQIVPAQCGVNNQGKLSTKIEGGLGPYSLSLQNTEGQTMESWTQSTPQHIYHLENLPLGDYILHVTDSQGRNYSQRFYLQSSDTPEWFLQDHYTLIEGQSLLLDASLNMPQNLQYQWYKEGRLLQNQPQLQITHAGSYQVHIQTPEGCQARKNINISGQSAQNIQSIDIFPNPSQGDFLVRILLLRKAATSLSIYTMDGKFLQSEALGEDSYFLYRGHISHGGIYLIKIDSENDSQTKKLIIRP